MTFGQKRGVKKYPKFADKQQVCDRCKYFGSPNQIQIQIRLVLLVLSDTKIHYH